MSVLRIVLFCVCFAVYWIGYFIGRKCKPKTIGVLLAVEDPVDHEVYLTASFKQHSDVDGLKNGEVVSFVVQR